jgi:putative transposase
MESWWEICRQVGNDGLRERQDGLKSRKSPVNACGWAGEYIIPADAPRPTSASQCQALTPAKKDHPQLKIPRSQVWQQMLRRNSAQALKCLETAGVDMYRRGFGFFRFKKKGNFAPLFFPKSRKPVSKGIKSIFRKLGNYDFSSLVPFGEQGCFIVNFFQMPNSSSGSNFVHFSFLGNFFGKKKW